MIIAAIVVKLMLNSIAFLSSRKGLRSECGTKLTIISGSIFP
jgi:hypothetical protein